jgi:hypothetical protein
MQPERIVRALLDEKRELEEWDPTAPFAAYHESQWAFALGRRLHGEGVRQIVLEARCPQYESDRCDVYIDSSQGEYWIEIKRGWLGHGPHWKTAPQEQFALWLQDLCRLSRLPPGSRGFVLVHYRQVGLPWESGPRPTLSREEAEAMLEAGDAGASVHSARDSMDQIEAVLRALGHAAREDHEVKGRGFSAEEELRYSVLAGIF